MVLQLKQSHDETVRGRRMAVLKKQLQKGAMSLSGAIAANLKSLEAIDEITTRTNDGSDDGSTPHHNAATPLMSASATSTTTTNDTNRVLHPPPAVASYLKELLWDGFRSYDLNKNGQLDSKEVHVFFRDFQENITEEEISELFVKFDEDKSGTISFDEFICLAYLLIKLQDSKTVELEDLVVVENTNNNNDRRSSPVTNDNNNTSNTNTQSHLLQTSISLSRGAFATEEQEEEEIPEELSDLPPDQQQAAIKKKAFAMLLAGSLLVLYFSDPMVDVLAAIATKANVSPFYVSFVLAPLASNASELIASQYYASKKTRKTIAVSLSALEGAACMNNTFCLSIFMGLIFFRGLAWQYTAETISILICQFVVGITVQAPHLKFITGTMILLLFPLSIALVAILEAIGLD